jgi:hypothetical protein
MPDGSEDGAAAKKSKVKASKADTATRRRKRAKTAAKS